MSIRRCCLTRIGRQTNQLNYLDRSGPVNEEAIYILEGQGRVRIGDRDVPVRAGDYVALLSGPDGAHQTFNDSTAVLRYLSTMIESEVKFYPESNRVGFLLGLRQVVDREQRFLEGFVSLDARVDY